ncbi:MAG: NAD(P)H-hydrate dehydratase [Pseudomonadota bacterium]
MTDLLTAAQMRAIEQAAIDAGEVTGLELMERAGQGVVDAIMDWRPEFAAPREDGRPHRAAILCGPGNNGGDGFVVARLLKERGWEVDVFLYGPTPDALETLPPDAATNARRWVAVGEIHPSDEFTGWEEGLDLRIEAILGTGLSRPLSGEARRLAERITRCGVADVVSVDLPAGLCSDSGRPLKGSQPDHLDCVEAAMTVTFEFRKLGHVLAEGPEICGELRVARLGLDGVPSISSAHLVGPGNVFHSNWLQKCADHKYDHGHALVLAGGVGRGGAARLAARGALRVGAGLVTVGCPLSALIENACRLDAVMLRAVDGAAGFLAFEGLEKVSAVCVGPGFGVGERCRAMVSAVLSGWGAKGSGGLEAHPTDRRAVVLDADALTSFEGDPPALFSMLHERCVLTPHMGEFRRLFPDIAAKLDAPAERGPAYSKVDAARDAAARAGCTVLLKGADTVIASADGRCAINSAAYERAAPWLATAGSGDVLAGFITGLLARGLAPQAAAETGAWLHVECALRFGPGLIAEDLPEELPAVFRALDL